jgi:hypothetical protein
LLRGSNDFANRAHSNLYSKGDALHLVCRDRLDITAIVNHVIQPSIYSSEMIVTVEGMSETRAILKLSNCPSISLIRKEYGHPEWDLFYEGKYREFVQNGGAAEFTSWLNNGNNEGYDFNEWDITQCETYLNDQCHELFEVEVIAYEAMKDIRGKYIPQLFVEVKAILSKSQRLTTSISLKSPASF